MKQKPLSLFYRHTPRGVNELTFALNFLQLVDASKLVLFLESDRQFAQVMPEGAGGAQCARLLNLVCGQHPALLPQQLEVRSCPQNADRSKLVANSLLIDRQPDLRCPELTAPILVPFDEPGLLCRGTGPFLLPFGDGRSAKRAACLALPLANMLGLSVVFYHTTWTEPGVLSQNPADHICPAADQVRQELETMASKAEVPYRTVIETTDDTVEGIVQCAMRCQARLIVMARRLKPGIGCYVMRAIKQSPVPLLIADDGGKRRAT